MIYCSGKARATVSISSIKENVISLHTPVEIDIESTISNNFKCWKVIGLDYYNQRVVFYGCAVNAELRSGASYGTHSASSGSPSDPYGVIPIFDNVPWNGNYGVDGRYHTGATIQQVTTMDESGILGGTCNDCLVASKYTLTIIDTTGKIYEKQFDKPPIYKVACDDECPLGHLRCPSNKYPGYCCIPCAAIADQINSIRARL